MGIALNEIVADPAPDLEGLKRSLIRLGKPRRKLTDWKTWEFARLRATGRDWPSEAETMIGRVRLDHLQQCVERVLKQEIPGDLLEAGVWRGGACILMRAVLKAFGDRQRLVWLADSFEGMPKQSAYREDLRDTHWKHNDVLSVSLSEVKAAFLRYGLLDDQVRFLPGWFHESLPGAPVGPLALLRIDGDMYGSTMDALTHLYPRLSPGGFLIVDDYGAVRGCRKAVDQYRQSQGIVTPIQAIDWTGVFWQKLD
jgi:O-methyltransferase